MAKSRFPSVLSQQLEAKRAFKGLYGDLSEKSLKKTFWWAMHEQGKSTYTFNDVFCGRLESRIDSLLYRMGFATSVLQARQYLRHGLVSLNNQSIPRGRNFAMPGDLLRVTGKVKKRHLEDLEIPKSIPSYIEIEWELGAGIFLYKPHLAEIPYTEEEIQIYLTRLKEHYTSR